MIVTRATEAWAPLPGYDGELEVSDLGRVRSWRPSKGPIRVTLPRVLTARHNLDRSLVMSLKGGLHPDRYVHVAQLVAETFILRGRTLVRISYRNGDRSDCRSSNLLVWWRTADGVECSNGIVIIPTAASTSRPYRAFKFGRRLLPRCCWGDVHVGMDRVDELERGSA